MNIDSIKNGLVIDHIRAGGAMELYRLLRLGDMDCTVAIIKNAPSAKLGRKDIIKIDSPEDIDLGESIFMMSLRPSLALGAFLMMATVQSMSPRRSRR